MHFRGLHSRRMVYITTIQSEKDIMMSTLSTAERMAMIREAARKFQQKQSKLRHFKLEESVNAKSNNRDTDDERHWTDASKYAKEYYGGVYYETTRFDNDWD